MAPTIRRIVVSGRVQGVGYRMSCAGVASRLEVDGHVRNLPDGTVEIVASGQPERVDELLAWCRVGPHAARVDRVTVVDQPVGVPAPRKGFRVSG